MIKAGTATAAPGNMKSRLIDRWTKTSDSLAIIFLKRSRIYKDVSVEVFGYSAA